MPTQNRILVLTFLILIVFFAYSAPIASGIDEKITPELREKSIFTPDGHARVIIKMKSAPSEKASAESGIMKIRASASAESLMENRRVLKTNALGSQIVAADMQLSDIEALAADANVEYVEEDMPVHALLSESVPLIGANSTWNQQIFDENITGTGTTVCIIDTGVDYTHPDLGGCDNETFLAGNCSKVIGGYDFVNEDDNPMDDNGHGTHVAGITAANGTVKGVAPGAKIVAIKVLKYDGWGNESVVVSGINWCVSNSTKFNISVISMSLGGESYTSYCDNYEHFFRDAINEAVAKNISVVVATGNDNFFTRISAPACIENATRVGSVNDGSGSTVADQISVFTAGGGTNRGSNFPDMLLAPGKWIISTYPTSTYKSLEGTSMAAPHVSGAIALLSQEHRKIYGTSETPQYFKSILNSTGKRIPDSGTGLYFPRINVSGAYDFILSNVPAATITISAPQNGSFANATDSIISASQNSVSDMNLSIDGGKNKSACLSCNSFTDSTGILAEGLHNITVYGSNILGAISHTTAYFTIDTIPPKIEFLNFTEENNSILDQSWIFINISINETNPANATISLFNIQGLANFSQITESGEYSVNWTNLADGVYYFSADAYDAAGNMNYTETRRVTIDTAKPNIEIINPKNTTYNSASRTLNYTASDANLDAVWYEYNGTNKTLANGQAELNPSFTALDNQQSTLTLYANDTVGHISSANITFAVDTVYPQIYFIGTEENNTYWNRTWIYANVSVIDSNFKNLTFYLSNAQINPTTYTDSARSINWTNLAEGTYYFNATVYDTAGNMNHTETRMITLDTTNPAIAFVNMTPENNSATNNWAYINITSNEPLSSALLEWNSMALNITMQGLGKNWYLNKTQLTSGNYTFRVYANDASGKWSATETRTIFAACIESWSYSDWSACSGGTQTRTATDANACGTTFNQSALSQSCTIAPPITPPPSGGGGGYSGGIVNIEAKNITKNITNITAGSTNVSAPLKTNSLNDSIAGNAHLNANNSSARENSSTEGTITAAPKADAAQKENKSAEETGAKRSTLSTTGYMVSNYLNFIAALVDQLIRLLLSWL